MKTTARTNTNINTKTMNTTNTKVVDENPKQTKIKTMRSTKTMTTNDNKNKEHAPRTLVNPITNTIKVTKQNQRPRTKLFKATP